MRVLLALLALVAGLPGLFFPGTPPGLPPVRVNPVDGSEMVLVPAGRFPMGSNEGPPIVRPRHLPYVEAVYLGRHEVTNEQFARFVRAARPVLKEASPPWWYFATLGRERHPVVQVSLEDARAYCRWAGGQLPTEAEWEKGARGTDGRQWPWGNDWDPARLRWGGSEVQDTAPVGSFPAGASPWGLLDMAGNVAEWVDANYRPYRWGWGNVDRLPQEILLGPEGPPIDWGLNENTVVRGGAWTDTPENCTTWMRNWKLEFSGSTTTGFRLAIDPAVFPENSRPRPALPPERRVDPEDEPEAFAPSTGQALQ